MHNYHQNLAKIKVHCLKEYGVYVWMSLGKNTLIQKNVSYKYSQANSMFFAI